MPSKDLKVTHNRCRPYVVPATVVNPGGALAFRVRTPVLAIVRSSMVICSSRSPLWGVAWITQAPRFCPGGVDRDTALTCLSPTGSPGSRVLARDSWCQGGEAPYADMGHFGKPRSDWRGAFGWQSLDSSYLFKAPCGCNPTVEHPFFLLICALLGVAYRGRALHAAAIIASRRSSPARFPQRPAMQSGARVHVDTRRLRDGPDLRTAEVGHVLRHLSRDRLRLSSARRRGLLYPRDAHHGHTGCFCSTVVMTERLRWRAGALTLTAS